MMASRMLRRSAVDHAPGPLGRLGGALARIYAYTLHRVLNYPVVVLVAAACVAAIALFGFGHLQHELTPSEDRSQISVIVQAPQNVSLDYTNAQMEKIEAQMAPLKANGEIQRVFSISGFGGNTNRGFIFVGLAPKSERSRSQQQIAADIDKYIARVPGVRAFAVSPNSLGIRGGGNGLQFALVGTSYDTLAKAADIVTATLSADPRFGGIRSSYDTTQAQVQVQIDRQRADALGVDITGLGTMLQSMLDGKSIGTITVGDTTYPLYLQSTSQPINDPTDLRNIFARTGDGRFVPMAEIVDIQEGPAAPTLTRESQRRAVDITASLSGGFPIGDAYAEARRILLPLLPTGVGIMPLAEAATIGENSSGLSTTFGFAALVILLVLAAQFESFISAGIIMITVPFGLACAVFALMLTGGTLNVYSEIGLVLLVGIMAKNGILVVEFANALRDRGRSVRQAIEEASAVRLRPIMMTKLATVIGALPLVMAHGPGSEARAALGWVIVGALGFAAVSTLYLTPSTYLLFAGLSKARSHEGQQLAEELARQAEAAARPKPPRPALAQAAEEPPPGQAGAEGTAGAVPPAPPVVVAA
jgi:HAE1 family hydrophobic/amphiphilic exporter-1